jgi:hypothetical protein
MAFDDSGNAWLGAWGGGLAKFDGTNWTIYNKLNSGLPSDSIFCIAIDDEGNKWMGTQFGLVKFDGTDWTVFNTENSGIFDNFVPYIGIDDNGNKWIGNLYKISIYNENGVVSVEENSNLSTTEFLLSQNYPNPFNPSTAINYQIPEESLVQIKVYDVMGREIKELVNEQKKAGFYRINFDGSNLSSGMYLYRIDAGKFSSVRKMLLVK